MSKKRSGKDSLPVSNSDEDVIVLDVDESSTDDLFPDISVTNKKTPSHHHHHITNCRPSASTGVDFDRTVCERPASMDAAMHGPKRCGPSASHNGDLVSPKTGGVAKPANQSITVATQRHGILLWNPPPTGKKKPPQKGTLLSPTRTPGLPGSSLPERNVQLAGRSDSARKVGKARAPHTPTMDSQHSGRFLDCMDLFTPSPAGERERHKQPSITPTAKQPNLTPRAGDGIEMSGKRHKIFATAGTLVRAKIGEKRPRKHSSEFERGKKVPPGSGKTARLHPGVGSSVPTANKEKSLQTGSKALSPTAVTEIPCSLVKHGCQSARGGTQSTTRGELDESMPPAGSVASKPVSQVPRSPQPFAKTAPKNPKLSQTALPQTKKVRKPSLSATTSKTPLSPPSVLPRHSSAPKIITLQHLQQNDSNGSSLNKDSETETSSSIFDFNENDLFEVLDSVESESICSAYNQSDGKSVGVNKPTSESSQSSKLVTSHTCKSPSDSRVHDFTQSFVKRKRKKPQVARKSTTLNGQRLYKHPLRGRGRIPMQQYCTISLPHLQNSIVQKARNDFAKYKQSKKQASAITAQVGLLKSTKKREKKLRNPSSTTAAKRIKLSSDFLASQPAAVDPNTSPPVQPASLPQTAQSNTSVQIPQTEQSQEKGQKGSLKPKEKGATASKKAVQVACRPQAPKPVMQTQAEKHSLGEKNNPRKKPDNRSLSPTGMFVPKPSPALKSSRPLPLILQRPSLSSQVSGGGLTNSVSSLSSPPDLSGEAPSVEGKKEFTRFVLGVPPTKSQKNGTTSEPVTPMFKKSLSLLKHSKPDTNRSASEQPSGEPDSVVRISSQPLSVEATVLDHIVQRGDKPVACVPASKPQHSHVSDQSSSAEGPLVESEAQVNGGIADKDEHVTKAIEEAGRTSVAAGDMEPMASTLHSGQGGLGTQPVEPETSTKEKNASGKLSQRDEVYDLRLLETIAKFAPDTADTTGNRNRELSSSDVEVGITRSSGAEVAKCPALTVKVPISQLHRIPTTSPVVITRPLGMFRDASVQAERGMMIDKDVLDTYLVVKLSEAMFDMKEQLQMMEAQVASITKQKESLERTLQAKTQYVRDMTTTGLKPTMVDKGTLTDETPISPEQIHPRTNSESSSQTKPKPKSRKSVQTQERGFQTRPKVSTVACQTDGFLRSVPPRLQVRSRPVCLYSYPESELQLYIEEGNKSVVRPSDTLDGRKEPTSLVGAGYNKWLSSVLGDGDCSRSVGVSPKVRFLKAIKTSSKTQSCARCSAGSMQVDATTCNCSNVEASSESSSTYKHEATSKVCFSPPLHATASKLIELYFKLKALPKEPVQERHMESVLEAVHHLLTHLPIEIKSPTPSTPVKPAARTSLQSPAVSTGPSSVIDSPTASDPLSPPSGEPTMSSPPSTPGAASWAMGAKMQGLVDVLQELDDQGKKVFPKYFKAELAQLQKKTKDTLAFLTVGLRHETFSHDKLGCIVASDIQLRPWRNQELKVNPFFHRLFLDVGIRGLLHKMNYLMRQNRKGRRLGKESSEEDSDLELLCSPPPSSEQRTRAQATSGSSRARKRKAVTVNGKKCKKTSTSKRERIRQLALEKQVRGDARDITILAPKPTSRESHPTPSTPPTDRCDLVPGAYTSTSKVSRTSSSEVARTSTSVIPLAATSSPVTTSSPTSPSPTRLSPYSKLISRGESFRLRLQSSVTPSHQPLAVSSETVASATAATYSRTIASIPCKTGGNVISQRTVGHYLQHIPHRRALPVSTASESSHPLGSMSTPSTSSTADALPSAPCSTSTATPCASTAVASAVAARSTESSSLPRVTLCNALETLACVLQKVKMSPGEKEALQKLIARALSLSRSTYAIDLHMAQLLVNQITQQLHTRAPSTMFSGGSSVLVQQVSPIMTYAYPTRSTFSASPNIVTPLTLPMTMRTPSNAVALSVCANSALQTPTDSEAGSDSVTVSVEECENAAEESSVDAVECTNAAVESSVAAPVTASVQESAVESSVAAPVTASVQESASSQPFAQQTPAPPPNTTLPLPRVSINMVSPTPPILQMPPIPLVANPAVPLHKVVAKQYKQQIIRLVVTTGHVRPMTTVQTKLDKQGPTTTTPKATLSTTTSTTAACGDVRMSPGVATAAVLATEPAQIQKPVSGEPNQNHVSTEPTMPDQQTHVSTERNKTQQPVSALPATVASTTTANTSKQLAVHCPRWSQSAEHPSSMEASSPSTMNTGACQGIAGLCDDVIIHKFSSGGEDTRKDAQEVHSIANATSSAEKVETMPRSCAASASSAAKSSITSTVSAPSVSLAPATNTIGKDTETRSSCSLPTSRVSNASVAMPIPSAGGLQSSSLRSVVSSAKPIATTTSIPSSITTSSSIGGVPVTAASVPVTTVTVRSSGKNGAISASSIIGVLKEITPLLSYLSCPAATVPIVTTSAPSTPTANTVHVPSTAITSSCTTSTANTIVPAASSVAAPIPPKGSTAAISTVSTDATPLASSLSAAPGTSTTNTKATIPCLSPTTATNTRTASKLATLFYAPLTTNTKATIPSKTTNIHAENVTLLAATPPSSSNTTPIATPISTSAQMCNSSVSTATFFASCTRNYHLIDSVATSTTTTQTGNLAVLSSRGQPGPIQAPIKPHGTTVNAASSLTSLPPSVPPSVVHVPSVSSLYHFSQRDLPVVKLQASKVVTGLVIKWTFSPEHLSWQNFVRRYDLYAFVSNRTSNIPDVSLWGKVGEIKPLALPMAVTLTNFAVGQRYAFAVRVSYVGGVTSRYSNPCTIEL